MIDNLRRDAMNTIWVVLAVVMVGVAGCSGTSQTASRSGDSGLASGSFDDWVAAVCQPGYDDRSAYNPVIMCNGDLPEAGGFRSQIMVFNYATESSMQMDRKMWVGEFGHTICLGANGDVSVFKPEVSGIGLPAPAADLAERSVQPLSEYGCAFTPPGSTTQPTQARPTRPSAAPSSPAAAPPNGGMQLPANAYGYTCVETKSGRVRCMIEQNRVICETSENNWPAHGVEISASGSTQFVNGNLGDIQATAMEYRTYRATGWTIVASSTGTRFTNDRTGHGAMVSAERVQSF